MNSWTKSHNRLTQGILIFVPLDNVHCMSSRSALSDGPMTDRLRRLEQGNKLALLIGARLAEDARKVGASRAEADTSSIWFSKCAAGAKTSGWAVQLWVASITLLIDAPSLS